MSDNLMQTAMQPYVKLVQSNMELVKKFSTSSEAGAQAAAGTQNLFQQGQELGANLVQSKAFTELAQGMLKNYTDFLTEVGQANMAMLTQGQAAMVQQVQEATGKVVEATKAGKRGG